MTRVHQRLVRFLFFRSVRVTSVPLGENLLWEKSMEGGNFLVDAKGMKRNVDKYRDTTMEKERRKILKMFKIIFKICPPLFAEIKRRKVQEEGRRLKTRLTRIFSLFLFQVSRGWRILSKRAYFFQNFKTPSLQISNRYSISKLLCPFHEHHS